MAASTLPLSNKFSSTGVSLKFAGNTVICHLPANCDLQRRLDALLQEFRDQGPSAHFIVLPSESRHVTIMGGVTDAVRDVGRWPQGKEQQSLAECTADFRTRLSNLPLRLGQEDLRPPYSMRVKGFRWFGAALGLVVSGSTREEEMRMRRLKDVLAYRLGVRNPGHDEYSWHISLAYQFRDVDAVTMDCLQEFLDAHVEQVGLEFELHQLEFCSFEDVTKFQHECYVGNNTNHDN